MIAGWEIRLAGKGENHGDEEQDEYENDQVETFSPTIVLQNNLLFTTRFNQEYSC